MMDAYKNPDKVENALVEYWKNGGKAPSTFATSTKAAGTSGAPSSAFRLTSSTITKAASVTSTKKVDDKKKATSTKRRG
jgi:hypothetical protein